MLLISSASASPALLRLPSPAPCLPPSLFLLLPQPQTLLLPASLTEQRYLLAWQEASKEGEEEGNRSVLSKVNAVV